VNTFRQFPAKVIYNSIAITSLQPAHIISVVFFLQETINDERKARKETEQECHYYYDFINHVE
jgi:hypothetical protein